MFLQAAGNCDKKKLGERGLTDDENERSLKQASKQASKQVGSVHFFSNVGQYESERAVRPF